MPIVTQCPNPECGQAITVEDHHRGMELACPYCHAPFRVPMAGPAAGPPAPGGPPPPPWQHSGPPPQKPGGAMGAPTIGGTLDAQHSYATEEHIGLWDAWEKMMGALQAPSEFFRIERQAGGLQPPMIFMAFIAVIIGIALLLCATVLGILIFAWPHVLMAVVHQWVYLLIWLALSTLCVNLAVTFSGMRHYTAGAARVAGYSLAPYSVYMIIVSLLVSIAARTLSIGVLLALPFLSFGVLVWEQIIMFIGIREMWRLDSPQTWKPWAIQLGLHIAIVIVPSYFLMYGSLATGWL